MAEFIPFAAAILLGFAGLGFLADHALPCITKRLTEWAEK